MPHWERWPVPSNAGGPAQELEMRVRTALLGLEAPGADDPDRAGYLRAKLDAVAALDDVVAFVAERDVALGGSRGRVPRGHGAGVASALAATGQQEVA